MKFVKYLYNTIKGIIKWLTLAENITQVYKWLNISKVLLGGTKAKKLVSLIDKAQSGIDSITGKVSNEEVDNIVEIVNSNNKGFNGISATLRKDKHGKGNHGIDLKLDTDYLDLTWDPTNGEIKFGI